jgi:hypothetical protein
MNFVLAVFPLIVSALIATDGSFVTVEYWFAGCGAVGMLLCLWLIRIDSTRLASVLWTP